MNATTKTRTQRRMEKKQTLILLVLVLAVSLASFFLGAVVGRQGAERELAQKQQAAERILVTPAPSSTAQPAPQVVEEEIAEEATEQATAVEAQDETKLTFYDNLAKEEKVPLGSGINLPPEEKVEQKTTTKPPIPLPEKPIVKKELPVESPAAPTKTEPVEVASAVMPKVDPKGTYAVQVGSFNAAGDAGAFKKRLLAKGFPAFVVEADLGAKGLWYRVRIGPYSDAASAKTVQKLAEEKEQIKGFISRQ
ncbi:Cell division protein FtsN [Malonomonas rubra DSM 5091]|uniref:Cell division protein FtsN n=1 Tax=Malonomonas rubra DSM 5091 TaxID=1122189 RepID=A0A1M6F1L9_MALRU|nr:SPOR domain-containing protein [Malonomonas rubra]SHI91551.1 Cell division protein FtsN [Malonomonas rubra DSM 5091]